MLSYTLNKRYLTKKYEYAILNQYLYILIKKRNFPKPDYLLVATGDYFSRTPFLKRDELLLNEPQGLYRTYLGSGSDSVLTQSERTEDGLPRWERPSLYFEFSEDGPYYPCESFLDWRIVFRL